MIGDIILWLMFLIVGMPLPLWIVCNILKILLHVDYSTTKSLSVIIRKSIVVALTACYFVIVAIGTYKQIVLHKPSSYDDSRDTIWDHPELYEPRW